MKRIKGSMTVEAAFAVPVFFLAVYTFLQLFLFLQVQLEVFQHMNRFVRTVSSHGTLVASVQNLVTSKEQEALLEEQGFDALLGSISEHAYLTYGLRKEMEDEPWIDCIVDGARGFHVDGSCLFDEGGELRLIVSYRYNLFGALSGVFSSIPVVQRIDGYGFFGRGWEQLRQEKVAEEVYIVENGSVYHCLSSCTYLKVSVSELATDNIEEARNQAGGCYYPCSACRGYPQRETVYITVHGDRYHKTLSCSNLLRNIKSISLEEAQGRNLPACSKCGR